MTEEMRRFAGRFGLAGVAVVVVILVIHPFGTTDIYETGEAFLDHVSGFWVVIHLVAAVVFAVFPLVYGAWTTTLTSAPARVLGATASMVCVAGFGVGVLHLVGTDTVTFWMYSDTLDASGGSEAGAIGADVLLRLHAATLMSWIVVFWFLAPLLAGIAALRDGSGPGWLGGGAIVGALVQIPAVAITLAEGQWTTVSEQVLFRTGATFHILFVAGLAITLRRGAPLGEPVPA
ncbi:MAG: hypothetical protein AAGE98_08725 [Actinomycetota bacterium]